MKVFLGMKNACDLNYQRKYLYSRLADKYELTNNPEEADIIIFSDTCCCTEYHTKNTLQYIISILKKKKPDAKTFLTGCITRKFKRYIDDYNFEEWLNNNIDYIIPQNTPNELLHLISEENYNNLDRKIFGAVLMPYSSNFAELYISNGCRNNCSFCKTTFQDYPLKSAEINELKEIIDFLNEKNVNEVLIKGTNICQYGLDLYNDYKLPELIEYIDKKDNIKKVVLVGFAYKDAIKNNFSTTLRDSEKTKRISGSLESGSNRLLKLIRKGFTTEEIIDFIREIKEKYPKEICLNLISGFPTETKEDVLMTLDTIKKIDPTRIDLCRYTNSKIVDSNNYPQLTPEEIEEHTRIYEKVLRKRNINTNIVGNGYKYNIIK